MKCAAYFKSGLGNFINAIPSFVALSNLDNRGLIDLVLDKDWLHDPRVPAIKDIALNSYYIENVLYWPEIDLNEYDRFLIPVQCEKSEAAKAMLARNRDNDCIKGYIWPNADWRKTYQHEIDVNLHNAYVLGCNPLPSMVSPIPKGDGPILLLNDNRYRPFFFGLCNGSFQAKFWEKKKWSYFPQLANELKNYYKGCSIIGIGGQGELEGCNLDYDFTGKLNILDTNKVISQLDYFITTDTGCMHISDAMRVKGLALFGPTLVSKNGPVYGTMKAIRKDILCAPCQEGEGFYTCNAYACMDLMTPNMVMDRIIQDLN